MSQVSWQSHPQTVSSPCVPVSVCEVSRPMHARGRTQPYTCTFGRRQVKLSIVWEAFVNVIARNSIDTPYINREHFVSLGLHGQPIYRWVARRNLHKYQEMDGFQQYVFALREIKISPKNCNSVHSHVLLTMLKSPERSKRQVTSDITLARQLSYIVRVANACCTCHKTASWRTYSTANYVCIGCTVANLASENRRLLGHVEPLLLSSPPTPSPYTFYKNKKTLKM